MAESDSKDLELHKKLAVALFNRTWDLIEKDDRTEAEDLEMIHSAHASRYHWSVAGTPFEAERGEWQIARAYSVLGRAEPAKYHAHHCLAICQELKIGDFDIAFAYEALARAYACDGEFRESSEYMELARQAGDDIAEEEDRKYFLEELETIPRG